MKISVAATYKDWVDVFQHCGAVDSIVFYKQFFDNPDKVSGYPITQLPNLGVSLTGSLMLDDAYIAIPTGAALAIEVVKLLDGTNKYSAANSSTQTDSLVLFPGGRYKDGYFVVGEITSVTSTGEVAYKAMKRISGRIRRSFHLGNGFWIGPECFELYNANSIFSEECRRPIDPIPGGNTAF